ncbi:MAG: helix-turn-helix transcriptional regulator [Polyangiales bacterium]
MPRTVTLITDQPGFANAWQPHLGVHGLEAIVRGPEELADAASRSVAVVLHAATQAYDEDELLSAVGFVRAAGLLAVVHVAPAGPLVQVDDVIHEMCSGLVARAEDDVRRIAAALARRVDQARSRRFEFVSVSPRDGEILAILGDGRSVLVRRPLGDADDLGDVVGIELSGDATSATLTLRGGSTVVLSSGDVVPSEIPAIHSVNQMPIDGTRLGQRLRELRLEAGLTQAELARRTGIHRPNIARVEAGRHTPSLETLARLASAIGVPTTRVLSGD